MGELQIQHSFSLPPPPLPPLPPPSSSSEADPPPPPPSSSLDDPPKRPSFDPSRMIGIIRRKALIRDLAAAFHAECLTHCQEILELQNKVQQPFLDDKVRENSRKESTRPAKRSKKHC